MSLTFFFSLPVVVAAFILVAPYWALHEAKQKTPLYVDVSIFVLRHWSPEFDCFCCPVGGGW